MVGEIQNIGEQNVQIDSVNATYYDSEGSVIEGPKMYALWIETLIPDQKAPFATVLLDENASKRIVNYELSVIYRTTREEPYQNLLILSQHLYNDSDPVRRWYQSGVVGEVQNTGTENIEEVRIFATLYDKAGSMIGFIATLVEFSVIVPGQKSPFEVPFVDPSLGHFPLDVIERMNSYQLGAYCTLSDKIPYRDFQILGHSYEEDWELSTWKYVVKGDVKNVGDQNASVVVVIATFYDDSGRLVDICLDYIGDLDAGDARALWVGSLRISLLLLICARGPLKGF